MMGEGKGNNGRLEPVLAIKLFKSDVGKAFQWSSTEHIHVQFIDSECRANVAFGLFCALVVGLKGVSYARADAGAGAGAASRAVGRTEARTKGRAEAGGAGRAAVVRITGRARVLNFADCTGLAGVARTLSIPPN